MKKTMKALVSVAAFAVMMLAMTIMVSAVEPTVTVPKKYYGNEKAFTKSYSLTQDKVLTNTTCGIVIPLKVSAPGTIKLNVNYTKLEEDVYAYVYRDAACTSQLSMQASPNSDSMSKEVYVPVNNAGTYYLKFYTYYGDYDRYLGVQFENKFTVSVAEFTKLDKTIKSGQKISYYRSSGSDAYWFKYKAEKTGTVTLSLPYKYGSYVTLCSAKKKALSQENWVSSNKSYKYTFAVKKGTTYFFRIKSNGIDSGELQSIYVKNKAIKEKSGSKKKKAVSIKAKKTIKGTILPGSKTCDWYKLSVKKKKSLKVYLDGDVTGTIKFTVYTKKGKKIGSYLWNGGKDGFFVTYSTTYKKVNKGTYYIKVSRNDSKSSGAYSLKWK